LRLLHFLNEKLGPDGARLPGSPCAGPHGPESSCARNRRLCANAIEFFSLVLDKGARNLNRGGIPQFPRLNAACYLLNPTENGPSTGSVDCTVDRHGGGSLMWWFETRFGGNGSVTDFEILMKLHVGNLSFSTTKSELLSLFSSYGAVTDVRVITDRTSGESRGFAFVTMRNRHEGLEAMGPLEELSLDGRNLTVSEAWWTQFDSQWSAPEDRVPNGRLFCSPSSLSRLQRPLAWKINSC
jgi:RNA recognition motif. (a.k.a. RRM, RBD, or RNP domain)